MACSTKEGRRKSLRLKGYDYSHPGAYFVTMCSEGYKAFFQERAVRDMIVSVWEELERKYSHVRLDEYVLMPNHFHGIIHIVGADLRVRPDAGEGADQQPPALSRMIQWFKTVATNRYMHGVRERRWPLFGVRLWQRSYYEHIIRSEDSLNKVRGYIRYNPVKWELDIYNPDCQESYKGFEDYLRERL